MAYQKNHALWLNEPNLDQTLKEELKMLSKEQLEDAFYKDIEFGTAGARGLMGPGTNRINIYTIKKIALGFSRYVKKQAPTSSVRVAISYDNRINSKLFAYTCARVLAAQGIESFITKELRPTPFLSYMVRTFKCDGGIMITASHNPKEYNGFKAYDDKGGQLVPHLADQLTEEVMKITNYFNIQELDKSHLIHEVDDELDASYLEKVKKIQLQDFKEKPLKFIYSPLHGTGGVLIPKLMRELGYHYHYVEEEMLPDGNFTHTKSSNPEDKNSYYNAIKLLDKVEGNYVLVTDPDADRLGVMVRENGKNIFLNGNQTAALELFYLLSTYQERGILPQDGVVYGSNVSTPLFRVISEDFNVKYHEVLTGFKFIGEAIEQTTRPYLFGAEESYGSLISPFVRDKDAIQAVLILTEMATYYHLQGKTLYNVLEDIYSRYGIINENTLSFTYEGVEGAQKILRIMNYLRDYGITIDGEEMVRTDDYMKGLSIYKDHSEPLETLKVNVIKYYYKKGHILIFRPSGTEPKLKVYMYISADSYKNGEAIYQKFYDKVNATLREI